MPFFDDSGPRPEEEYSPIWRSFALVKDQLERLILVNLLWSCQTVPLLVALALDQIPLWVRIVLGLYTIVILAPATATLFSVIAELSDGVPLDGELLWNHFKVQLKPGFVKLLPLMSLFYWVGSLANYAATQGWLIVDTLAQLVLLFLLVFSLYWGPLLVYEPELSAWSLFYKSIRRFWNNPAQTLLVGLACFLALVLGVISIAGFLLIIPALIALFQINLYRSVKANWNANLKILKG